MPDEPVTSAAPRHEPGARPSGGVTFADTRGGVVVGGDAVGRDKVTTIHAEAGATVVIGSAPAAPIRDEPPAPGASPYLGLCYFDVADAGLFFGRGRLTAELAARLRLQHFLAVVGASGSGKSSLVRAGVVAAMQRGEPLADGTQPPPESARWRVHILTPTARPLESLAVSLTRDTESVSAAATLMDDLATDPRSLHLYIRRLLSGGSAPHLLLVIDQFEELFTACKDEVERKAFVDNLLIAAEADALTTVIIALRADFYAHCLQFNNLRQALEKYQAAIGAMSAAELRLAIEEPARSRGWEFEAGLVDLLLRDVGAGDNCTPEPGALPLLSHALLETWKRRRGQVLTLAGYQATGGVYRAIAHTAEAVLHNLSAEQQVMARRIFVRLTELGEGPSDGLPSPDTRRRARLSELMTVPGQQSTIESVLKVLTDARLVTTARDTAEVAHEALIREWPTLRQWLEADRESLRLHRHLTESAVEWEHHDQRVEDLYGGTRLGQALEWAKTHDAEMTPSERAFLKASRSAQARRVLLTRLRFASMAGIIFAALLVVSTMTILAATGHLNGLIFRPLPVEWVSIPAGEFLMGSTNDDPAAQVSEKPQHVVYLNAFAIGKYEVTNLQYRQCVKAGACRQPRNSLYLESQYANYPVWVAYWDEAQTFCEWTGGRLPTEAEWEKAARGTDGRLYPWGNEAADCTRANFLGKSNGTEQCSTDLAPVGSHPSGASPYGVMDMAGNTAEWVGDWYKSDYYRLSPPRNPMGPGTGDYRATRGGFYWDPASLIRAAARSAFDSSYGDIGIGIRCAHSP